ncbi:heterotrimeric G protein alpha subunit A [Blakeslea trispora]|nr:heterotrimeric G protein alpha subunit A [Blakeslea trispora]
MGACLSSEERDEKLHSYKIDKTIEQDDKNRKKEFKMLLLGSGESGKSTIFKQMKILHQNGYTTEELKNWRLTVFRNIIQSAHMVANALRQFDYPIQSEKLEYEIQRIIDYRLTEDTLDPLFVDAVLSLWPTSVVSSMLEAHASEFYLMDSAAYFFENLDRIAQPDYIPTTQDVVHARSKTTGIVETRFSINKITIHMFDVGGQRSERKKWIHCFESVDSIVFCVSLSEYDQVLLEESRQNRMMESLVLFESVINSRWFSTTTIILFLNKVDIFKEKIKKVPLEKYFPDYGGGKKVNLAAKYILWRFNQMNRAKLKIYPHLTQATSTTNMDHTFQGIRETLIQSQLNDSGIL